MLSLWLTDDSGVTLSGGEWQKVALARLFMRDAELLVFDEPTAALDAEAARELHDRFSALLRGRTRILIAHRAEAVRKADVVAVLDNGKIVECGRHSDLVDHDGRNARFYCMQAEQYR